MREVLGSWNIRGNTFVEKLTILIFIFLVVIVINKFRCVIRLLRSMGGVSGLRISMI